MGQGKQARIIYKPVSEEKLGQHTITNGQNGA